MTLSRTSTNLLAALGALTLSAGVLTGCTPEPAPTPTPTAAFASEEEAFAAAEEVYGAYLEATAASAAGDKEADPQKYLLGEALESNIDAQRTLEGAGLTLVGETTIHSFTGVSAKTDSAVANVAAEICIDISATRVLDAEGTDVTLPDRPERGLLHVEFSGTSTELRIVSSIPAEDQAC